jgi:phosphoglycolate phosphatase-like HAD superfamily hydrolase
MKDIQAIFLDFDGVVLESVEVKGWAFGKLFEDYPDHVDEIVAFHHAHAGMSRFEKLRFIHKNILKIPLSDQRFDKLCADFSRLVFDRVLECDFVPGALEFIKEYYSKCLLFIISATPHEEINKIVKAKGLDPYFSGVFGSPSQKHVWVNMIIDEKKLERQKVLFVGDAMSDFEAARKNNICFIGRITDANDIFKKKQIYYKIKDLHELTSLLQGNL